MDVFSAVSLQRNQRQKLSKLQRQVSEQNHLICENDIKEAEIQEKDMLILHLKQQIACLVECRQECKKLETLISELQQKYLSFANTKSSHHLQNQAELSHIQSQYRQLKITLQGLSNQSVRLYQLILEKQTLHVKNRQVLAQKHYAVQKEKEKIQIEKLINKKRNSQNQSEKKRIKEQENEAFKLREKFESSSKYHENIKSKLSELEKKIQEFQKEKKQLSYVLEAAEKDNLVLKQNLRKVKELDQQKAKTYKAIQNKKQNLMLEKKQLKAQVLRLESEAQLHKNQFLKAKQELHENQQIQSSLVVFNMEILPQIAQLQHQISEYLAIRQDMIAGFETKRQRLQRLTYFIEQYQNLNRQLIKEMKIMMNEQIGKDWRGKRSHMIDQMRLFLNRASQQIQKGQLRLDSLRKALRSS